MSRIKSEIELLKSYIGEVKNEEELKMVKVDVLNGVVVNELTDEERELVELNEKRELMIMAIEGELMDAPVDMSLVEEYEEILAGIEFQIIKLLDMEEEDDMYDYHYQVLQLALKSASEWSVVLGRRIKGRYQKHWIKVQGVQERADMILTDAYEQRLSNSFKYFTENGLHQEELYLLNKYFEFVVELKTRKTYDYQTVSKYAYELGDKIKGYIK